MLWASRLHISNRQNKKNMQKTLSTFHKSVYLLVLGLAITLSLCAYACGEKQNVAEPQKDGKEQVEEVEDTSTLMGQWRQEMKDKLREEWNDNVLTVGENSMKIWYKYYGDAPRGDRSLWISMHGGGSAPARVNDQQWDNQKRLYQPSEGLYVAPRAPWNDWDLWFKPGMDELLHKLIVCAVLFEGVNPDKVYLMGYSAGGDGVWRMAPRMADSWAAASMMAGHPGDVSLVSLRNTPFMIWCGALDSAYNRNKECEQRGKVMDRLQAEDPGGYIHETHIQEGREHWMYLDDAAALPWMAKYTRNPRPDRVVWMQGDVNHKDFYWLGLPDLTGVKKGMAVTVRKDGNNFDIESCDYPSIRIYLDENMVDFKKRVTVKYNGKTVFKEKVSPSDEVRKNTLYDREDPSYVFSAVIDVKVK